MTTTTPPNPNPAVNGWCPKCEEWSVRGRQQECMWCSTPLQVGPSNPTPLGKARERVG